MMKNLLVGNGINIQFNKTEYTAQSIVLRVLKNCNRKDFPAHIIVNYPYLLQNYLGHLFLEARELIKGTYDHIAFGSAEKESLKSFKKRYSDSIRSLKMTDIGFEDYYLIHDLSSHKHNIHNPDQFYIRESMKVAYLYAIFNDGKLNKLYENYPNKLNDYLCGFDNIFTTNYDSNIELATGKEVFHIHGQFDIKSDVYEASSFRNQMPDAPIRNIEIDEKYYYLYSNALSTYCGEYKEFQIKSHSQANQCVERMSEAYKTDPKLKTEIDGWTKDSNTLTANLGYAIQLKAANPDLTFNDDYHFNEFKSMTGTLEILGLSPWNDFHIFEAISCAELEKCEYYFFDESECDVMSKILPELSGGGKLVFRPVQLFWEELF